MADKPDIKAMLHENKARRKKYFRIVDPVRGDSMSEVVPRSPFDIEGETYWLPDEMIRDDFVRDYLRYGGASGVLNAGGEEDTEENRNAVVEELFNLRL